jgi:predicted TIM-barrel fold metal-dependent hydrolase
LRGVIVSPFKQRLPASDQRMAGVLAACQELGVPIYLHTGINWWTEVAYDIGHPRYIDAVASAYPDLKIVCLHAAWPWVNDLMMIAWRHDNVFIDISAHRPAHMTIEEAGWAPLLYWGNRVLAERVVFGSTWTLMSRSPGELADEVRKLPLKQDVIEKWLFGNAERLFAPC